jgi:hypothetical protein
MQRSTANLKSNATRTQKQKESLSMAWIDYQNAFDRVPHSWIIKSLELIGINNKVIAFTKKAMTYWRTRTRLHTENALIETEDIKVQCGIIQGDSLSPLLFLHLFDSSY